MNRSERAAMGAGVWLVAVLIGLLGGWVAWHQAMQPDYHLEKVLYLEPVAAPARIAPVPLVNGARQPWALPAGKRPARFAVTIPGDEPVLRFHEGFLQGLPELAVRLEREDGERVELGTLPGSDGAWTEHRLAVPADAGDDVIFEFAALDGEGRPGLGLLYLADVCLLSGGREVDESEASIETHSVVADLLSGTVLDQITAPPTADSARVGLPGPTCLPLRAQESQYFEIRAVPPRATLQLVLHAGKHSASGIASTSTVSVRAGDQLVARLRVDGLALPRDGHAPDREMLFSLGLQPWVGQDLVLSLTLSSADNLFVGVREAFVSAERTRLRRPFHPQKGTNLLLVLVDGLRGDRLGGWGYERGHTPHLDDIARHGLVYRKVLAPSSWPLPNVATLLTGLSPLQHGLGLQRDRVLSPRVTTLAQSATWGGRLTGVIRTGTMLGAVHGLDRGYHTNVWRPLPASTLVDQALDWLEDAREFPWFLTLHVDDPMAPHEAEREDLEFLPLDPDPELMQRLVALDGRPGVADALASEVGMLLDAEIARVDRALGRVLAALDGHGILDNTVVAVVGTSGQELFEHGGRHAGQTLFDEVVEVPVLLVGPGVPQGVIDEPVALEEITDVLGHLGKVLTEGTRPGDLAPPLGPSLPDRTVHALLRPFEGVTRRDQEASRRQDLLMLHDRPSGRRALYQGGVDRLLDEDDVAARGEVSALSAAFEAWYESQIVSVEARPVRWVPESP